MQARNKYGGHLPWVKLIVEDLHILRDALPSKLASMPDPHEDLQSYWSLAKSHPAEWKQLVKMYFTSAEDARNTKGATSVSAMSPAHDCQAFLCTDCGLVFPDHRRLSTHRWSKHGVKNDIRAYIGDISSCPVCKTQFHSRARLIKHLLERRVRAKSRLASVSWRSLTAILHASIEILSANLKHGMQN